MNQQNFLTWKTDPFLIDPIPTRKNDWLTANKLLEQKEQSKIFLKNDILNLYSIMVRKNDFLAGERLIQRLPYVSLPPDLASSLRKPSLKLAERCHYYFQDTAINYSIKKWQQKIIDYTEKQHRLPFPLFRMSDFWQDFLMQKYVPFQSARGETFHLPTILSKDLAYFLGVVIGDGHLNYYNIELVDFSQEHTIMLQKLAMKLFGIEGAISGEKKVWLLHLNNKWLVRLANFLTDQPITGKKYHALREPLIFTSDENLRWEFWNGVLDADGSYKSQINFCSSSKKFIEAFGSFLDSYNFDYKIRELTSDLGNGYSLNIKAKHKHFFSQFIQPRHPIKQEDFSQHLNRQSNKNLNNPTFKRMYIKDINPQTLVTINDTAFFNFELIPMLNVTNCTSYLRKSRETNQWTQQDLANFLEIQKGRLAAYEYTGNLPIAYLVKLLPIIPKSTPHLMLFLKRNKHNYFRSRKTIAKLDLEPTSSLLSLMKSLVFCKDYITIKNKRPIITELKDQFEIEIVKKNLIKNSVLHRFIKTFFLLSTERE